MIFDIRSFTVKSKLLLWPVFALALTWTAQAQQGKFAVINIQGAIISTKDGQKAASELPQSVQQTVAENDVGQCQAPQS